MKQLTEDPAVVSLAGIGQVPEAWDAGVVVGDEKQIGEAVGRVQVHALENDQPRPAARPGGVVADHVVAHQAVAGAQGGAVGRREKPVLNHDAAELDGREEVWKSAHAVDRQNPSPNPLAALGLNHDGSPL